MLVHLRLRSVQTGRIVLQFPLGLRLDERLLFIHPSVTEFRSASVVARGGRLPEVHPYDAVECAGHLADETGLLDHRLATAFDDLLQKPLEILPVLLARWKSAYRILTGTAPIELRRRRIFTRKYAGFVGICCNSKSQPCPATVISCPRSHLPYIENSRYETSIPF